MLLYHFQRVNCETEFYHVPCADLVLFDSARIATFDLYKVSKEDIPFQSSFSLKVSFKNTLNELLILLSNRSSLRR